MPFVFVNKSLVPHPTHPDVVGVFKRCDYEKIMGFMQDVFPGKVANRMFESDRHALIKDLLFRLGRKTTHGYIPSIRVLKARYHTSQDTLQRLHYGLIGFLKELGYGKDEN